MNSVKLFVLLLAAAVFAAACGESASTPNVRNTAAANTAAVNRTASSNTAAVNAAPRNLPANRRQLSAVAAVEDLEPSPDLYAENCMICHKDSGKGGKVSIEGKSLTVADLTSEKMKKRTDDKLAAQVSDGVPDEGMPSFKDKLSAQQIKQIVAHLRSLQSR